MSYQAFLLVMSQLAGKKKARAVVQGSVIFFESSSNRKNRMKISTKIFDGEGYLPKSVRSCVSSSGKLQWQQGGAYIKLDAETHSVYLIEEVEMEAGKYIPFKNTLADFSLAAKEWKNTLQGFAEKDYTPIS